MKHILSLKALAAAVVLGLIFGVFAKAPVADAAAAGQGEIDIRVWVDTDGDSQYSKQEGIAMNGTRFLIVNNNGTAVDKSKCTYNDFTTGGVGRSWCKGLADGSYTVTFLNQDLRQYSGPLKSRYNSRGQNPVTVTIKKGFRINPIDFGYKLKKNAQTGELMVRALVDLDWNGEFNHPGSGEGNYFNWKKYEIRDSRGKQIDYTKCDYYQNKLITFGHSVCRGLEAGTYTVKFLGEDSKTYVGPIKSKYNPTGTNPTKVTVKNGQFNNVDFIYNFKADLEIRAFLDKNGDKKYTPNGGEGSVFAYKKVKITNARGQEIDYARYCGGNTLGGAGRLSCKGMADGPYTVKFLGENPATYVGPFKNQYNKSGTNPVSGKLDPKESEIVDFGYVSKPV
jgi:hypothetical protein